MHRRRFCVANWKMNFNSSDTKSFLENWKKKDLKNKEVKTIFCPSFTELNFCQTFARLIAKPGVLIAQNNLGSMYGTGTGTEGGLVGNAKELLQEMDSLNMILDVSHTSDESVRQELEIFKGPVIATHQNCRSITPGERQFPDHQIKSVIERGGVIGHSMDTYMLWNKEIDWSNIPPERPFPKDEVTLENYVDHIDYVCQLAGNSLHAAIGGDTDGQGGMIGAPYEIDTVADYQKIVQLLEQRGYENEDIENIMYKNWQRFFELYLPN